MFYISVIIKYIFNETLKASLEFLFLKSLTCCKRGSYCMYFKGNLVLLDFLSYKYSNIEKNDFYLSRFVSKNLCKY